MFDVLFTVYFVALMFSFFVGNIITISYYVYKYFSKDISKKIYPFELIPELFYGFINPIIYLTAFQFTGLFHWNVYYLFVASFALIAFWIYRFTSSSVFKTESKMILYLCISVLVVFFIKDLILNTAMLGAFDFNFGMIIVYLGLLSYYFIPFLILISHLRYINGISIEGNYHLIQQRRLFKYIAAVTLIFLFLSTLAFNISSEKEEVLNLIIDNKETIEKYGEKYNVSPEIIASIIYVNNTEYISPIRRKLEDIYASKFFPAYSNYFDGTVGPDFSLGICQIKPTTAFKAFLISKKEINNRDIIADTVRELWSDLDSKSIDLECKNVSKLYPMLVDIENNINYCALLLHLYQEQWRSTYSVDESILATLYQIGFEKSKPKLNPISNEFGRKVASIAKSEKIKNIFKF